MFPAIDGQEEIGDEAAQPLVFFRGEKQPGIS
jgi:hypothetical protein